ncbi:lymphocyte antigen 75-like [Clarias gariepinus]
MILLSITIFALVHSVLGNCETGWREYEDRCYFFSSDFKKWHDALDTCLSKGGNLMSILSLHERVWISTQIGEAIYWIGLNDIVSEGNWEWSDGSIYYPYLEYWRPGQPDNYNDNEDCGQVDGKSDGRWNDEHCTAQRQYICKRDNENPTVVCDEANQWEKFGSNCYKLHYIQRKSWVSARTECLREGADLVSVESAEEEQYILGLDPSHYDLWLGFSTLKCTSISCQVEPDSTKFTWSDAATFSYTHWASGQPDLTDKQNGLCTGLVKAGEDYGKWRTHLCRSEHPYACKRALNTVCPLGWVSFKGSCYLVVSNSHLLTSWHEALTRCTSMGANLLTIKNEEEQYFVNAMLPDLHHIDIPDVWIGISDMDQDGSFRWVDKTNIEFSNWSPNFPKNTDNMWDCGQIYTGNYAGKWETGNCFKVQAYICKMLGGQNVKPTPAPESHCDQGYLLYGDHCYYFESESIKTWEDAENYCVSQNGHLASIHDQETVSFITAHITRASWIGLNDRKEESKFVWSDGSATDFLPWGEGQPDNWGDEDCVQIRGTEHFETGKFNDILCSHTYPFICKKDKGVGPPPVPPTSGPGWNEKCGSWVPAPFNDYCYHIVPLSMRKWAEARADCVHQNGDLLSITETHEQSFIQAHIQSVPTGVSLWMGGHDSVTEGGWEWTDLSPFCYINWSPGNPDNYDGEDCLSIYINNGLWNDDNCDYRRGYICKRRGNTPEPPPPHDGYLTAYTCEGSPMVLHCAQNSVINIQSAFFGRRSDTICPYEVGSTGQCTVPGMYDLVSKQCDNHQACSLFAHTDNDPCPTISKYLEVVYTCEQNVCVRGLGVEDGNVTDSMISASSSRAGKEPKYARLNGQSCWMPSSTSNSWIQVSLPLLKKITGVVIQGCPTADDWVTKFTIQTSKDGYSWDDYKLDGKVEVFFGAVDKSSPVTQLFSLPVSVKHIRIVLSEWHNQAGLRFEILGCTPDYAINCGTKPNLDHSVDRLTVHCPAGCAEQPYSVYGSLTYRGDSTICAAAIHAGVVLNELGGDCTLLKAPGLNFYIGSLRNGITTNQYNGAYSVSYQFADGELRCSGNDWYEFGEFCYKPHSDKKTWFEALAACRRHGADLVSIMSLTEQSWIESYLYEATSDVWIGLNDLEHPGYFVWSDKHEVKFTYWAPGEPNSHMGFKEDCVEMYHQSGRWNDVTCTEMNSYICKMAKGHYPLPSIKPTVYGCPEGWDAFEYSCYWFEQTAKTRAQAKAFCESKSSVLVHITDVYEQSHFTAFLSSFSGNWWIGLRAKGESAGVNYQWDNGTALVFTHWDRDYPDDSKGDCVAMTTTPLAGFWRNKNCEDAHPFICESYRNGISPPTLAPTPTPVPGCQPGWYGKPHFRQCYRIFSVDYSKKKSWNAAREDCLSRGADLISIHNVEEELFIATYTKDKTQWIGLTQEPMSGGYHWSDGTPVAHTNWGDGEPNDHGGRESCVELATTKNGTSYWNDLNCDAQQDWVCMIAKGKQPVDPPEPPPPSPAPDCGTNPGWRKHNGVCYYYNDTDMVDFYTALARCYMEKALLVSILDQQEQTFVLSMVGTGQIDSAWIGLRMFGVVNGEYLWVDGSPMTYVFWANGEPNNADGEEQCVQMSRHPGTWNDVNCGRAISGYVCKKLPGDDHTAPTPTPKWDGNCPEGWMLFHNKCFLIRGRYAHNEKRANWTYARDWCRENEGQLATIDDINENDFVASYLRDVDHAAWIGLSDGAYEGKFAWSDGVSPVLFTNWADKEPNNNNGEEHCVSMTHNHVVTGRWNDEKCDEERSWVCYRKKSSDLPAPPTSSLCRSDYISWYKNCYKLVSQPKPWEEALAACKKEGGNLASVDMSYDQAFISAVLQQNKEDTWIGLRRTDNRVYQWTDGWPVFYTHWGPGEPTNHEEEGCVSMHGRSFFIQGTWNDTNCKLAKPYLCKISHESPPPTPPPGNGECLEGWQAYGSHCYEIHNGSRALSWPEARHKCQETAGSELASVHSRAEATFLTTVNTGGDNLWLGLTRDGSCTLLNFIKGIVKLNKDSSKRCFFFPQIDFKKMQMWVESGSRFTL